MALSGPGGNCPVRRPRSRSRARAISGYLPIGDWPSIRNIYKLDFLDPRLLLGDVRTLLLEDRTVGR